jgi:hypothetical protein
MAQQGKGGKGGGRRLRNTGRCALTASRNPPHQRRFIGALSCRRITRESPLRQSADRNKPAVDLWRLQVLELKGWGAFLSLQQGRIKCFKFVGKG